MTADPAPAYPSRLSKRSSPFRPLPEPELAVVAGRRGRIVGHLNGDETIRLALAKASKEHGLRDALEAGSTLRAAYDRFGLL
jgi:hypothetical protein